MAGELTPGGSRIGARVALVAAVLGLVAGSAAGATAAQPVRAASGPAFFGIAPAVSTSEAEMRRLAAGGARVARVSVNWGAVQRRAGGPYNWNPVDGFMLLATRYGITPLPQLVGSPSFAANDMFRPPLDSAQARARWQHFVQAAVRRYGTTGPGSFWHEINNCNVPQGFCEPGFPVRPVRVWQVWNEPNMKLFWKPVPSVPEYATLLRLTASAIRSVDSRATVVTGGLTPGGGRYGPHGTEFLADLYRSGPETAAAFDAVGIHPYEERPAEVIADVEQFRGVMNQAGDAGGLWITEFGWATGGKPGKQVTTIPEQADRIGEVMETLGRRRDRYGLRAMLAFTAHDYSNSTSPCTWCPYAGLMFADGSPKPAWPRFASIARAMADGPPRLVTTSSSTGKAVSKRRGRKRKVSARTTTTVERYADGSVIVQMTGDDLKLSRGRWDIASCLRFLSGARPGDGDHSECERQRLRVKSRSKLIAPGDRLLTLGAGELAREPYAGRTSVVGYVQAHKRMKGKWRNQLTSLRKRARGIPLR